MLLKIFHKIKEFTIAHKMGSLFFAVGIFLLLPIYDKYLWIENAPFDFGHIVALEKYDNIAHIPEYKPYMFYFLHLLSVPFYLVACVAMQEEEYRLSILPEMSIYMLAWLLVLAYHCFMLILPFTLKDFVQTAKEKQKRFLYWLYGISLPGILLSLAYILFCFSGGDWGDCNCGGTFVWLRQLPLSGYIPIIYFVTITALYQYKYSKEKK